MSNYQDKIRARKRLQANSNPIVPIINKITPGGYALKQPPMYDFYEGEAPLNWDAINATDPVRLVFQVTVGRHGRHGDDEIDRSVLDYVAGAKANGRRYGLYHLLVPNSITEQVDFYCRGVDTCGGWADMTPVVDIEYEPPVGRDTFRGTGWAYQIQVALDILTQRSGYKPLIYWSRKFAGYTADRYGNLPVWMKDYWHWMAGYPWTPYVDANIVMPQAYYAQGISLDNLAAWQYAEDGRYRGYPANDLSQIYSGYISFLQATFGG